MLELLRAFAVNMGVVLLVYAGFALIERGRPAERGQPFSAVAFNVEYLAHLPAHQPPAAAAC